MRANLVSQSTAENLGSLESRRTHTPSDSLLRILNGLFYAFMWLGLLWILLGNLPVRLTIPFGDSELREIDLVVFGFLSLWALRVVLRGRIPSPGMNWPIYSIVLLLLIPVSVGLAVGKPVATVLRDVRIPIYYATMLPMLDVLRNHVDLRRLERFIVVVGLVSMLTSIGLWFVSRFTSSSELLQQRYGIASLNIMGTWLLFLAVASILFTDAGATGRRWTGVLVGLGLIQTYVASDGRSTYVGVCAGLLFLVGAPWLWYRRNRLAAKLRQRWIKWGVVVSGLLLALMTLIGIGMVWSDLDVRDVVKNNMTLRRFYSLVDPTIEENGAQNREDRFLALSYGFELGIRNYGLGLGYGDNPFVDLNQNQIDGLINRNQREGNSGNVVEGLLFYHNSFGWTFARLGLWLAMVYFFLVGAFVVHAWRSAWQTKLVGLRVFLFATLAFVIATLISGFGGPFFFDYFGYNMVFWLIALTVLLHGVSLARE